MSDDERHRGEESLAQAEAASSRGERLATDGRHAFLEGLAVVRSDHSADALVAFLQAAELFSATGHGERVADILRAAADMRDHPTSRPGRGYVLHEDDELQRMAEQHRLLLVARDLYAAAGRTEKAADCEFAVANILEFSAGTSDHEDLQRHFGTGRLQLFHEALACLSRVRGVFARISQDAKLADVAFAVAGIVSFRDEEEEAVSHYRQAVDLFVAQGCHYQAIRCLFELWHVFRALRRPEDELASVIEAGDLWARSGFPGQASFLSH